LKKSAFSSKSSAPRQSIGLSVFILYLCLLVRHFLSVSIPSITLAYPLAALIFFLFCFFVVLALNPSSLPLCGSDRTALLAPYIPRNEYLRDTRSLFAYYFLRSFFFAVPRGFRYTGLSQSTAVQAHASFPPPQPSITSPHMFPSILSPEVADLKGPTNFLKSQSSWSV